MAYCKNKECEFNEDGCFCEYEGSITIDENGNCETFRFKTVESNDD